MCRAGYALVCGLASTTYTCQLHNIVITWDWNGLDRRRRRGKGSRWEIKGSGNLLVKSDTECGCVVMARKTCDANRNLGLLLLFVNNRLRRSAEFEIAKRSFRSGAGSDVHDQSLQHLGHIFLVTFVRNQVLLFLEIGGQIVQSPMKGTVYFFLQTNQFERSFANGMLSADRSIYFVRSLHSRVEPVPTRLCVPINKHSRKADTVHSLPLLIHFDLRQVA